MNRKTWNAPPFVASLLVALVSILAPFTSTASPPGEQVVTNEQFLAPHDTGQFFDNAIPADTDIAGATADIESINTATVNVTVEPNNTVSGLAANLGIVVNVNDSSPPAGYAAQNFVAVATPAETFREAHSDAILHGLAGQILLTATSLVRGVEYNLLC
jgi:hypothetical protein